MDERLTAIHKSSERIGKVAVAEAEKIGPDDAALACVNVAFQMKLAVRPKDEIVHWLKDQAEQLRTSGAVGATKH